MKNILEIENFLNSIHPVKITSGLHLGSQHKSSYDIRRSQAFFSLNKITVYPNTSEDRWSKTHIQFGRLCKAKVPLFVPKIDVLFNLTKRSRVTFQSSGRIFYKTQKPKVKNCSSINQRLQ